MLFFAASWFVISKTLFWSGSIKTIFLPSATHRFAHSGVVPVNLPLEARSFAQPSSESQPRVTFCSGFDTWRANGEFAHAMQSTRNPPPHLSSGNKNGLGIFPTILAAGQFDRRGLHV